MDAGALEDGAHRTTGDDTGTGGSRTQQHDTGSGFALHRVRNRGSDARHAEEVALGLFDTLGDGQGHLAGLAVADADQTVAVADDHEGGEAEATTTLHDLRDAVDGDDALQELVVAAIARVAITTTLVAVTAAAATFARGLCLSRAGSRLGDDRGRLGSGSSRFGHFVLLVVTHSASPPSRAPSAMAATRPA